MNKIKKIALKELTDVDLLETMKLDKEMMLHLYHDCNRPNDFDERIQNAVQSDVIQDLNRSLEVQKDMLETTKRIRDGLVCVLVENGDK